MISVEENIIFHQGDFAIIVSEAKRKITFVASIVNNNVITITNGRYDVFKRKNGFWTNASYEKLLKL